MTSDSQLEQCAQQLNQSDDYQVLTKLQPQTAFNPSSPTAVHKVCVIDTETTGLDTEKCEIIELGYQIIEFDSSGHFYQVLCSKNLLNEPEGEISPEITKVTGIKPEDVIGHAIPWQEVEQDMSDVSLCVAHNAGFDRPVVERYNPIFVDKIWGCSASQINWMEVADVGSRAQEMLCWKVGQFFYGAHRALDDVQALSKLLSCSVTTEQVPAFSFLLKAVRLSKSMVKATGAPFDIKDDLRSRGYRWNVSERVWQKVIDDSKLQDELGWLIDHQTPNPNVIKLKATDTFSVRAK